MYNEENRGSSIKYFVIQTLFVIIFVLLLVWLFPTKTDISKLFGKSDDATVSNQVYSDNMEAMKDAAVSYYTNTRLPKEVNSSDKMTLKEMLDEKLLLPLMDSNNNQCDVDTSYVKVTKLNDEYQMEVHLDCTGVSDYIIVHLGCYDYCEGNICEKKEEVKPVKACTKTCKSGYKLINKNSENCYCKKTTTTVVKTTCPLTSCDAGYTLMNSGKADCYCKRNEEKKLYNYYKVIDNSYWTDYSSWVTTYREETKTLKRKELTYITVAKKQETPVYQYKYKKTTTTGGYSCSDWGYSYQVYPYTLALGNTYSLNGTETVALSLADTLVIGECGNCTAAMNYQYYVKTRSCGDNTSTSTEYKWFSSNPGTTWVYTGESTQTGTKTTYEDTKWVKVNEIPAGYVKIKEETKKYYSYSEFISSLSKEYTTSENPNLGNGWIRMN